MDKYTGKSILNGIAIGRIFFYQRGEQTVSKVEVSDCEAEICRFETAKEGAIRQLTSLYQKAVEKVGEASASIFEVHQMLLLDEAYNTSVYNQIRNEHVNAEFAVAAAGEHFYGIFESLEDEYFKARAIDVKDISRRVINVLMGESTDAELGEEPVIVVAEELTPSETIQMDKSKLLAFVTQLGSPHSHTAILARTMNIPALIGVEIQKEWHGKMAIIDGKKGILYIDPDEATIERYIKKQKALEKKRELLALLKGLPDITKDGRELKLYANIGSVEDMEAVTENDAAGIGLFRSEFLYLEKENFPTEDEQFHIYKAVAERMETKKVVIRTLDIGADKKIDYFQLEDEVNPAMGYRAIRICLDRADIFKTQLRAIYRASVFGNISIMFPMIISVKEVKAIKKICREVKAELKAEGQKYKDVELGIMIETPAAVMMSDELAKEVDFLSIGTNDLTQYTLAVDRQNPKLDAFYDVHHPAVLRMIQMVITNGHKEGCWVGICGELAADVNLTKDFIKMGVDELSVAPSFVLPIRKIIREYEE